MRNTNFFEYHGSNWDTKKVKDVAAVNEENISSSDIYDEIEYIEISTVNKGEISDIPIINFDEAPSRAKRKVKQNDILISTVRPNLEHYTFIKSANSNTIASTGFAVITAKEIEPRFLYYVLTSQKYTDYFSMIAEGHTSAYPAMNPDVIENVEIPVPPKKEQKRIAHILGTLDDKIELNQRMNETLEAIARAIFKSWFVDFDPVKAKMAGEPYPLPDAIMALFPDALVESELGMIPKGWEVGKLGDFIKIFDSERIPLSRREREKRKGDYPYYGATKIIDYIDDFIFDGIYVLMGEDGSVSTEKGYPVLQYVWGIFWANNHAHVLQGINGFSTEFLYLLLSFTNISPYVTGAVQPKINQKNMKKIPVIKPNIQVLNKFDGIIQKIFNYVRYNQNAQEPISNILNIYIEKFFVL